MLLDRYLPRIEFDSYEDFKTNYRVNVPEHFNFGFDIVDEWAKQEPEKKALVLAPALVKRLKKVVLPTIGRPIIPQERAMFLPPKRFPPHYKTFWRSAQ